MNNYDEIFNEFFHFIFFGDLKRLNFRLYIKENYIRLHESITTYQSRMSRDMKYKDHTRMIDFMQETVIE